MNIEISRPVMAHMKKKGKNDLTLTIRTSGGGCCPTFEVADVEMRKPEAVDDYNLINFEGVHVYVAKTAKITAPILKFNLEKSFFSKSIVPAGLTLKKQ